MAGEGPIGSLGLGQLPLPPRPGAGPLPIVEFILQSHRRWSGEKHSKFPICLPNPYKCAPPETAVPVQSADGRAGEHHHHDASSGGAELQLASDAAEAAAGGQWRVRRRRRQGRSRSWSWWWCWWPRRKAANATASAAASCAGAKEEMPVVRPVSK